MVIYTYMRTHLRTHTRPRVYILRCSSSFSLYFNLCTSSYCRSFSLVSSPKRNYPQTTKCLDAIWYFLQISCLAYLSESNSGTPVDQFLYNIKVLCLFFIYKVLCRQNRDILGCGELELYQS